MVSLNIQIPEELNAKLKARASEAGHASVEEYLQAIVRAEAAMEADFGAPSHLSPRNREELERLLLEGLASPTFTPTDDDWEQMRNRVLGKRGHE